MTFVLSRSSSTTSRPTSAWAPPSVVRAGVRSAPRSLASRRHHGWLSSAVRQSMSCADLPARRRTCAHGTQGCHGEDVLARGRANPGGVGERARHGRSGHACVASDVMDGWAGNGLISRLRRRRHATGRGQSRSFRRWCVRARTRRSHRPVRNRRALRGRAERRHRAQQGCRRNPVDGCR